LRGLAKIRRQVALARVKVANHRRRLWIAGQSRAPQPGLAGQGVAFDAAAGQQGGAVTELRGPMAPLGGCTVMRRRGGKLGGAGGGLLGEHAQREMRGGQVGPGGRCQQPERFRRRVRGGVVRGSAAWGSAAWGGSAWGGGAWGSGAWGKSARGCFALGHAGLGYSALGYSSLGHSTEGRFPLRGVIAQQRQCPSELALGGPAAGRKLIVLRRPGRIAQLVRPGGQDMAEQRLSFDRASRSGLAAPFQRLLVVGRPSGIARGRREQPGLAASADALQRERGQQGLCPNHARPNHARPNHARFDHVGLGRAPQPAQRGVRAGWHAEAQQVAAAEPELRVRPAASCGAGELTKCALVPAVLGQDHAMGHQRGGSAQHGAAAPVKTLHPRHSNQSARCCRGIVAAEYCRAVNGWRVWRASAQ
jgi:hypothetical protein